MRPESFLAGMRAFEADIVGSPETRKALMQMLDLVEETQEQVRVLLKANKTLLETIEILKKK